MQTRTGFSRWQIKATSGNVCSSMNTSMVGRKRKIDVFSDFSTGRSRTENDDWGDLLSKRIKVVRSEPVAHQTAMANSR